MSIVPLIEINNILRKHLYQKSKYLAYEISHLITHIGQVIILLKPTQFLKTNQFRIATSNEDIKLLMTLSITMKYGLK